MRFGDLAKKAQQMFNKRGGSDALKEDVGELRDIARGEGSLSDKAKRAAEAVKDPGAPGAEPRTTEPAAGEPPATEPPAGGPRAAEPPAGGPAPGPGSSAPGAADEPPPPATPAP